MGRPRKPVEEHVKNGTYKPGRHGPLPAAPDDPTGPPAKPADLSGDAAGFWDRVVPLIATIARDRDAPMLAEMCFFWGQMQRLKAEVEAASPLDTTYNRLLVGLGICTDKFDRIAAKFGLTPQDRAKLKVIEVAGPPKPKVDARKPTKLDKMGPPKGGV